MPYVAFYCVKNYEKLVGQVFFIFRMSPTSSHRPFFKVSDYEGHTSPFFYQSFKLFQNQSVKEDGRAIRSFSEVWCAWQESNLQPTVPKTGALSTELQARTYLFQLQRKNSMKIFQTQRHKPLFLIILFRYAYSFLLRLKYAKNSLLPEPPKIGESMTPTRSNPYCFMPCVTRSITS